MAIFYSATARGFYNTDAHGEPMIDLGAGPVVNPNCRIPALSDLVDVTASEYAALLGAMQQDCEIVPDAEGRPFAQPRFADDSDEPEPTEHTESTEAA